MTTTRPTIGNTYAIGRFNPDGPEGYAPVYNDGTHGASMTPLGSSHITRREKSIRRWHSNRPKSQCWR